jgi:hypothetical protein
VPAKVGEISIGLVKVTGVDIGSRVGGWGKIQISVNIPLSCNQEFRQENSHDLTTIHP